MASGKEAKKEEAPAGEAAPKKSKKMLIIIVGAVVLVAVIAVAAVMLLGKKKGDAAEGKEDAEEAAPAHAKFDPHKPPVFVALEPFTVNLASEDGNEQFLQVVASLRVGDEKIGEEVKAFMPQIRHEVLSLLAGKKPSEITSPEGREQLASDIKDICNEVMGWEPPTTKKKKKGAAEEEATGPVISVYFTQFIVQ